jgi:hypothetical protein
MPRWAAEPEKIINNYNFNIGTVHILLLCIMTNKCTSVLQNITLPHVSTLSFHPLGACNQYLAKLHKYFKCSCWQCNLQLRCFT